MKSLISWWLKDLNALVVHLDGRVALWNIDREDSCNPNYAGCQIWVWQRGQIAKAIASHPLKFLGVSIKQNLQSTVQWLLDLGLAKRQIAKAVATCFLKFLGVSIKQNLQPTVQWLLDLGLAKRQIAKAVAMFPQILGYQHQAELATDCTMVARLGPGRRGKLQRRLPCFLKFLGVSIKQNLQPTVQWLLDLGLTNRQIAKAVATQALQFLAISIKQNLQPTVQWLARLGPDEQANCKGSCFHIPQFLAIASSRTCNRLYNGC